MHKIVFPNNSIGWTGGDNYLANAIGAFKELESEGLVTILDFPKASRFKKSAPIARINEQIEHVLYSRKGVNFPWPISRYSNSKIFWIPDLQDVELPSFFSEEEIENRHKTRVTLMKKGYRIFLGSETSADLFVRTFSYDKVSFVRFAMPPSFVQNLQLNSPDFSCVENCNSKAAYFYLPNQWWRHKNHISLIKAYRSYLECGGRYHLVLTGSETDPRWHEEHNAIELEISTISPEKIHRLGQIDRFAQLQTLAHCFLLVQPSLYEGWSTSIEEGIALRKAIICSNLPILQEQTMNYPKINYVDPMDVDGITHSLLESENLQFNNVFSSNGDFRWNRFKSDLMDVLNAD